MTPKIATCCYCGTRAALSLRGNERHELACSNCGAPLHEMKMLRTAAVESRDQKRSMPTRGQTSKQGDWDQRRRKKKKKTKSLKRRFFEEVFDAAEDIFDIFD